MNEIIKKYNDAVNKCELFKGLNFEQTADAFSVFGATEKSYKKGDFLHFPYEKNDKFALVLEGTVNVCADDIKGNQTVMHVCQSGETFGEALNLINKENSPMYAKALEDTTVLWLKADSLFCGTDIKNSDLQRRFSTMIAKKVLEKNTHIQILSKVTLKEKIITFISANKKNETDKIITVPFNREDMANYLGTNRAALSRELSKLKKEGIIDFYKNTFKIL